VVPTGVDCSKTSAGPKDCGSGGGDNGVHTYTFVAEDPTPAVEPSPTTAAPAVDPSETTAAPAVDPSPTTAAPAEDSSPTTEAPAVDESPTTVAPTNGTTDSTPSSAESNSEEAVEQQCEKFSFDETKFVTTTPTEIPGAIATSVTNAFVSHAGLMNGAYVKGKGKRLDAVRRMKDTRNQYLLGIYEDPYAKMVQITLSLSTDGIIKAAATSARYKKVTSEAAKAAYSTSDKMTAFWTTSTGQRVATSDGSAGYGIKGLHIKNCKENADAIKQGKKLDELIDEFIDAQAGSEDACHSQLLEAKHQLNQLHALVADLARQVNATEEQIMVYDKMLQQRLEELADLDKWKDSELAKCKAEKNKASGMFAKLKTEIEEMHSIANPSVAMDVKDAKLHQVSFAQIVNRHVTTAIDAAGLGPSFEEDLDKLSALQTNHVAHVAPETGHLKPAARKLPEREVFGLLRDTEQASQDLRACIARSNVKISLIVFSQQKPAKSDEECQAEKDKLEKTYVKAYVELSRLKAEYEELANSTACGDTTLEQYKNRKEPLQKDANRLAAAINEKVAELQSLRPRLEGALASEKELRKHVETLTSECDDLGPTVSDLDKVRDTITALSACPGLSRVQFALPRWVGTWVSFDQNSKANTDEEQDKEMDVACNKIAPGSRAAEVGEIQEQTVEGIPTTNTSPAPLLGACPDCAGALDETFQSKHGRICWDTDVALDLSSRRENCGIGKKSILCVVDRADIRQVPGESSDETAKVVQKRF
jgi:hypothetical protein